MSCLFDSLSTFFKDVTAYQLRQDICNYLESNPSIIDDIPVDDIVKWENDSSLGAYIKKMRNESEWGTALEIISFCNITGSKVVVRYKNRFIDFIPKTPIKYEIHIGYTGNHYFPVEGREL